MPFWRPDLVVFALQLAMLAVGVLQLVRCGIDVFPITLHAFVQPAGAVAPMIERELATRGVPAFAPAE